MTRAIHVHVDVHVNVDVDVDVNGFFLSIAAMLQIFNGGASLRW